MALPLPDSVAAFATRAQVAVCCVVAALLCVWPLAAARAETARMSIEAMVIAPEARVSLPECMLDSTGDTPNCGLAFVVLGAETVCAADGICDLRGGQTMSLEAYRQYIDEGRSGGQPAI